MSKNNHTPPNKNNGDSRFPKRLKTITVRDTEYLVNDTQMDLLSQLLASMSHENNNDKTKNIDSMDDIDIVSNKKRNNNNNNNIIILMELIII